MEFYTIGCLWRNHPVDLLNKWQRAGWHLHYTLKCETFVIFVVAKPRHYED